MTLLEAEALAAAYVEHDIPARAFKRPLFPGYAVLVRSLGETTVLNEPPINLWASIETFLSIANPTITEDDETADPTLLVSPGDDPLGLGVPDHGGPVQVDPAGPTVADLLRRHHPTG